MKTSFVLSLIVSLLAALTAAAGLLWPGFYQDNDFVRMAWYGNDWVTLVIVIPSFWISLYFSKQGAVWAELIWMGLLGYLFYNYAFYLFGARFNVFFLSYVAILSLSAFGLISGLPVLLEKIRPYSIKSKGWVIGYLVLIAGILCMVEIPPSLNYLTTGTIPQIVESSQHPTSVVFALDLSIVVPLSVLAAILFVRSTRWGLVLTAIMLVKGATYGLVLVVNTLLMRFRGIADDPLLPFYGFVALGGLAGLVWLLGEYKNESQYFESL